MEAYTLMKPLDPLIARLTAAIEILKVLMLEDPFCSSSNGIFPGGLYKLDQVPIHNIDHSLKLPTMSMRKDSFEDLWCRTLEDVFNRRSRWQSGSSFSQIPSVLFSTLEARPFTLCTCFSLLHLVALNLFRTTSLAGGGWLAPSIPLCWRLHSERTVICVDISNCWAIFAQYWRNMLGWTPWMRTIRVICLMAWRMRVCVAR